MDAFAGIFLALVAAAGAFRVRNNESPERLYWWAGFAPYILMGLVGAALG